MLSLTSTRLQSQTITRNTDGGWFVATYSSIKRVVSLRNHGPDRWSSRIPFEIQVTLAPSNLLPPLLGSFVPGIEVDAFVEEKEEAEEEWRESREWLLYT